MNIEFETPFLGTEENREDALKIGKILKQCLDALEMIVPKGRARSLITTKLQEVAYFAMLGRIEYYNVSPMWKADRKSDELLFTLKDR